jgi:hypothetical protein
MAASVTADSAFASRGAVTFDAVAPLTVSQIAETTCNNPVTTTSVSTVLAAAPRIANPIFSKLAIDTATIGASFAFSDTASSVITDSAATAADIEAFLATRDIAKFTHGSRGIRDIANRTFTTRVTNAIVAVAVPAAACAVGSVLSSPVTTAAVSAAPCVDACATVRVADATFRVFSTYAPATGQLSII